MTRYVTPKRPINWFKFDLQSRQQVLKAYCHNTYVYCEWNFICMYYAILTCLLNINFKQFLNYHKTFWISCGKISFIKKCLVLHTVKLQVEANVSFSKNTTFNAMGRSTDYGHPMKA